jgi:hypothetical protein
MPMIVIKDNVFGSLEANMTYDCLQCCYLIPRVGSLRHRPEGPRIEQPLYDPRCRFTWVGHGKFPSSNQRSVTTNA